MTSTITTDTINLDDIIKASMKKKVEEVAPNFRRKNTLTQDQIEKIIQTISINLEIEPEKVLIAMMLLFLQGAANAGTPPTLSVDLGNNKCVEKRNIVSACNAATGHTFIRRIAETLAVQIGNFAYQNKLAGELGYRINNKLKAESGESLTEKEMAFCSSFSQVIPNLSDITSERLSKLLAADYQRRFDNKNKKATKQENSPQKKKGGKKKK